MTAIEELRALLSEKYCHEDIAGRFATVRSDEEAAFVANEYIKRAVRKCAAVCRSVARNKMATEGLAAYDCSDALLSALEPEGTVAGELSGSALSRKNNPDAALEPEGK